MTAHHDVIDVITLTPLSEAAKCELGRVADTDEFDLDWATPVRTVRPERAKMTLSFRSGDFEVTFKTKPSARKQKLLDAGFKAEKAEQILDVLGEL